MNNVPVNEHDLERAIQYLKMLRGTDSLVARFEHAIKEHGAQPMTSAEALAIVIAGMRPVVDCVFGVGAFDRYLATGIDPSPNARAATTPTQER